MNTAIFLLFTVMYMNGDACRVFDVKSEVFGSSRFESLGQEYISSTGRATYKSGGEKPLFLFHTCVGNVSGIGRWIINDALDTGKAILFCDSWAVSPQHIPFVNDGHRIQWNVHNNEIWIPDSSFELECVDGVDTTIFIDIANDPWQLSGYYVEISDSVYSRIRYDSQTAQFLYYVDGDWIIGGVPGVKSGIAFTRSTVQSPRFLSNQNWNVHFDDKWTPFRVSIIIADSEYSLPEAIRATRNISNLPHISHKSFRLRNGLTIPAVGLGMGGLPMSSILDILQDSIDNGYRMFDSAREYGNEWTLRELLANQSQDLTRRDLFIISKVWPTFLGFTPTSSEVLASLAQLKSSYVNLYFLHWASCNPSIKWMHCETTVNPNGTWRESYRALERAYAEGKIASIGLSNFDDNLLREVWDMATIRPHVVQNHGEPGRMDRVVRKWCADNGVVYMPYAVQRNINTLPFRLQTALSQIALSRNSTVNSVVLKFFHQTGAVVIPRSTNRRHLSSNIRAVSELLDLTVEELLLLGWGEANESGKSGEL